MEIYKWNPVYNLVMKIKKEYLDKFSNISYNKDGDTTCLETWIEKLGNEEYKNIFKYIQLNQKDNMILIRYGKYADVFGGEEDITSDIFWNMYDGFYKECRSIVIDLELEIIVLSPFSKFKNLNEGEENQLDVILDKINNAKSIEITNKLDGSMQSARYITEYNKIIMSGSQAIDISNSWRLEDGYTLLISQPNYVDMINQNQHYTFIFEFISLKDAHVVNYKKEEEGLYLIGVRNSLTGEQLSYNQVKGFSDKYNVLTTEIFDKDFDTVLEEIKTIKANEMEGFVISIDGYMIKVKADDYVNIHRILSKISSINLIIKNIADDTFDDLISKVPYAYKWRIDKVADIVLNYVKNMDKNVKEYYNKSPKDNKKDFMIWIEKNVPKEYRVYVRNLYLGNKVNYLKSGNEKSPSYRNLKSMGIENYSDVFILE